MEGLVAAKQTASSGMLPANIPPQPAVGNLISVHQQSY